MFFQKWMKNHILFIQKNGENLLTKQKIIYMIIYILIFALCAVIATIAFYSIAQKPTQNATSSINNNLLLKAYENAVALYDGENIKEVYYDIVLDALPLKDKTLLKSGIPIESNEQLNSLLEDYDG